MDPRIPSEDERRKLQKIYRTHNLIGRYMNFSIYPVLALLPIVYFLKPPIIIPSAIAIIILIITIYFGIRRELIKRCPRCSMWGIPPINNNSDHVQGNCPRCGMHLDPLYQEQNSEVYQWYTQSGSRGYFSPSPHNTLRAGPHRAFHRENRTVVGLLITTCSSLKS